MKKMMTIVAVLFSALVVCAQNFGRVGVGVVPNADVVAFSRGGKMYETPMAKKCIELQKSLENEEWFREMSKHDSNDDLAQLKAAGEKFINALGYKKDECIVDNVLFSLAFNDMFLDENAEPDFEKMDVLIALELKKPLNLVALNKAASDSMALLDDDAKDSITMNLGVIGTAPTLTFTIKDEDDIPENFKKLTVALIDPKLIVFGPEKSVKAALERSTAKTPVTLDPFFTALADDAFVAVRMIPVIAKAIAGMGDEATPAWGMIAKGAGLALTSNVAENVKISLNAYLNSAEEAKAAKEQLWDGKIGPMVGMFTPSVSAGIGGELPMLKTINAAAAEKVFGISLNFSVEDIKVLLDYAKKEYEAKKAAPAAPAVPAAPAAPAN